MARGLDGSASNARPIEARPVRARVRRTNAFSSPLAMFDARLYIRVRQIDELA